MDRFSEMRAFVEAAHSGGLAAAGRKLGLSRSQISKMILGLEARLGSKLLHRNNRAQSLSEAGAAFLERAMDVLALVDEAEAAAGNLQEEPAGLIKLNTPMSFGTIRLAPILPEFIERHPQIALHVELDDHQLDPVQHGFDLTVRIAALDDSSLIARKLCDVQRVVCASPGYLAAHGMPGQPADLRQHQCIVYGASASAHHWAFLGPDGIETVSVRGRLSANNGDVIREAALAGIGIIALPDFLIEGDLAAGRLQPVLPGWSRPAYGAYALYPPDRQLPRKTRALIEFLVEKLSPGAIRR